MTKVDVPSDLEPLFGLTDELCEPEFSLTKFSHVYCSDCAIKFNNCKNKLRSAIFLKNDVELVSINYKGHKRYDKSSMHKIESNFNKDKNESERELRIMAKYFNRDMVINVEIMKEKRESETDSGGTYIYTVWKYTGYAVKRM